MEQLSKDAFFIHLEAVNCTIMKTTKYGYLKTRNNKSGKVIGIQPLDHYLAPTICKYCSSLRVPPPDALKELMQKLDDFDNIDALPGPGEQLN